MTKVLVTGGTGFVAQHIIKQLLEKGYDVKTTVRNQQGIEKINKVFPNNNNLSFVKLDLTKSDGWREAMEGIDYVFSVASPVSFNKEDDILEIASLGITNILLAANETSVKKVVMTSNFGAVGFSNMDKQVITTEEMWTSPDQEGLSIYEKSKLLAEMRAWDYIKENKPSYQFATVNPVAIYGPSLSGHVSGSFSLIDGSLAALPNLPLNITDVRDVASLHIAVMESDKAANHRFVSSSAGSITIKDIYEQISGEYPSYSLHKKTRIIPSWILSLMAVVNKEARGGKLLLNINRNISTSNSKQLLNWEPEFTNQQVISATIESILKFENE